MKGLLVHVYRRNSSFPKNQEQVSNYIDCFILVGDGIEGNFDATRTTDVLYLQEDKERDYVWCTPTKENKGDLVFTPFMAGGNFIFSSDSRFPSKYPIPIFDCRETWEDYHTLSRD